MNRFFCTAALFASLILFGEAASATNAQESWSDPNFAFCEGIGAGASGRVNANAEYEVEGSTITLTSLSVTTTGHRFNHIAAGTIKYVDETGASRTLTLQQPWFDVMGAAGPGDVLYLPRNRTSASTAGPWEQMSITISAQTPIFIDLNLLFAVDGGNCPSSFSATWMLP